LTLSDGKANLAYTNFEVVRQDNQTSKIVLYPCSARSNGTWPKNQAAS